ncbi:hypothetical protein FLAG1_09491 [Fusarium langsethiae]|uniref:Uncharacterized protein n=1 Tax=Fusarium langsethiae TaxID=179993 RepID=A0A0M9EQ93_FUSLA|nr:hypothetical protein FLAG1_09491 [Fusarium langsethiae]
MAPRRVEWQCVHVLPQNLRHVPGHLVGPSIHPSELEVAVPSNAHIRDEHIEHQSTEATIWQLPVANEAIVQYGFKLAQDNAFKSFLTQSVEGIKRYGPDLAAYYQRRYIILRPWIEYAILINELPSATQAETFVSLVMFLALAFATPDSMMASQITPMTTEQVLSKLETRLRSEMWSAQPRIDILVTMRRILVKSGRVTQIGACGEPYERSIAGIVSEIMSEHPAEKLHDSIDVVALHENLCRCQALSGHRVDMRFIQQAAHKLGYAYWMPIPPHAGYLFTKFGESLIATQDPSQMVLDIVALMCIARLFTTGALKRLEKPEKHLIDMIGLPSIPPKDDLHIESYWLHRIAYNETHSQGLKAVDEGLEDPHQWFTEHPARMPCQEHQGDDMGQLRVQSA